MKDKKLKIIIPAIIIIAGYFLIRGSGLVQQYINNPEMLKTLILGVGIWAPLVVIFLQFFQTTISIIPSQVTTVIAGFLFGPIWGLFYSLIGAFFGSLLIFTISRKYGKRIALKFFEKKDIVHFNHLFKQKKRWSLFLARIAPIFPNDLVSFCAGLTSIKTREFNFISTIGFLVQMIILTYFGSELASGKISFTLIAISLVVSALILISLFKNKIKRVVIKDLHLIEDEIEKEFDKI